MGFHARAQAACQPRCNLADDSGASRPGAVAVPAHQVHAVVVAVGRADQRMHMKLLRLGIAEKDARVMVEFDDQDRTLDAVMPVKA